MSPLLSFVRCDVLKGSTFFIIEVDLQTLTAYCNLLYESMGLTANGHSEAVSQRRHNMPEPEQPEQALNLWSVLK